MRKSTEKQAKFENEAQVEPSAKKSRSDNRITSIVTLDNDTTVEVFKYLKYCGLAKASLVSKQFSNLIYTHRHTLALLYVDFIRVHMTTYLYPSDKDPPVIKIFNKKLSPNAYNEWIFRNGYSKQIPLETQIAGRYGRQYERTVYHLYAGENYYKGLKPLSERKSVFDARIDLSHENWPGFQHFFRLLTDPLIYIRSMGLPGEQDVFVVSCIISIMGRTASSYHKLLPNNGGIREFYLNTTGANCRSRIYIKIYEPCKLIAGFVQKFMDLKSCDENKVVESIDSNPNPNVNMDVLKRFYADFVVEENETSGSWLVFEFVNNDIGMKLWLNVNLDLNHHKSNISVKIANM